VVGAPTLRRIVRHIFPGVPDEARESGSTRDGRGGFLPVGGAVGSFERPGYARSTPDGLLFGRGFDSRHLHGMTGLHQLQSRPFSSPIHTHRTMKTQLQFTKMTGAGNDFVLLDNMNDTLRIPAADLARQFCNRNFGVGADGLLILSKSPVADFTMGYYNADGSTGGMCGNGGRCSARYAYERGIAGSTMRFEAFGHVYQAEVTDRGIRLHMKPPQNIRQNISLLLEGTTWTGCSVDTGAPHLVLQTKDLQSVDVDRVGRWACHHQAFQPLGTNVNFLEPLDASSIKIRTYERGVEAETLACGTGSVASALVYNMLTGASSPVTVHARSGQELVIHFTRKADGAYVEAALEGGARLVFDGVCTLDDVAMTMESTFSVPQPLGGR
jgi:diaminopimelate epimerase